MCGYCYLTGAQAAGEAGVLIGGPIAYAVYRRARRALGLPDTAVAPMPPESRMPAAREPVGTTRPALGSPVATANA